jgi:hypothetical protein
LDKDTTIDNMNEKSQEVYDNISNYKDRYRNNIEEELKKLDIGKHIYDNPYERRYAELSKIKERINNLLIKIFNMKKDYSEPFLISEHEVETTKNGFSFYDMDSVTVYFSFTEIIRKDGVELNGKSVTISDLASEIIRDERTIAKIKEIDEKMRESRKFFNLDKDDFLKDISKVEVDDNRVKATSYDIDNIYLIYENGGERIGLPTYNEYELRDILNYRCSISESISNACSEINEAYEKLNRIEHKIEKDFRDSLVSEEI